MKAAEILRQAAGLIRVGWVTRGDSAMKLSDDEIAKDQKILAEIIAGAERSGRPVGPSCSHDGVVGHNAGWGLLSGDGPCCAVTAGIIYRGVDGRGLARGNPLTVFAKKYGVRKSYAQGVSDGFEYSRYLDSNYRGLLRNVRDVRAYQRGLHVGRAMFDYLTCGG